jgi:alpha-tubulin suppressor-like RCC1 family protein
MHSLFVTTNGTLWAMGWNAFGQLGNGTTNNSAPPVSVASNVLVAAAGDFFSLFLTTDGALWAMGNPQSAELATGINGLQADVLTPVNVASNVVEVATGEMDSYFLKSDGTLWGAGDNSFGQLATNKPWLVIIAPRLIATNVVGMAGGAYHLLFTTMDGTLWGLGRNEEGELGNGTTNNTYTPIVVASNVVAAAAGCAHSLFVTCDGTLWTMGYNQCGQLGNGTTNFVNVPVSVASNVVAVAAGYFDSLFVKADGTLWTMGQNVSGQLGDGTTNDSLTPILVPHLSVANIFAGWSASQSLVVGTMQVPATVALGNLIQLYTGSAINVTASTAPPGLTVNLTYNGSLIAPTNAGSYTVIGTVSDPNYYGSATNTLVIGMPPQSFTASSTSGVNGQQLTLQLSGTPAYLYILQTATNLTPPVSWQSVFTNPADGNGNWSLTLSNLVALPGGFYRAVGQ